MERKPVGIIRSLDTLGRICLPQEYRDYLDIKPKDKVEICLYDDGTIVIKKHKKEGK